MSNRIFEETNVVLSASTLKRIWGKVRYDSSPNLSTLDALARFAHFPNWRSFVSSFEYIGEKPTPTTRKTSARKVVALVLSIGLCLIMAGMVFFRPLVNELTYRNVHFSSRPVTIGVPNTVVFQYDASQSNADSVFIQQNWDYRRRVQVAKEQHEHTSTYYMPGYYRAKLVLNDSVVREHDIFIESPGWLGFFYKEPVPMYLPEDTFIHGDWFGIKDDDIDLIANPMVNNGEVPVFVLTQVNKDWSVSSKNFALDIELQNTYARPNNPCRQTTILLLGTDGVINIPLSTPGCVGELNLRLGGKVIEGTTNDLSVFGTDFEHPVHIMCVAKANNISVDLNGKTVYDGAFINGIGNIVGARISFQGTGWIKSFGLSNVD